MEIGMIGHFGGEKCFADGQTIKTKELYNYLVKTQIATICVLDTYFINGNLFGFFFNLLKMLKKCDKILLLVSSRGFKVLIPLLVIFNIFYKKELFDIVIGGIRQEYLSKNRILCFFAQQFTRTYVESNELVRKYQKIGFKRCEFLPNFKNLTIIREIQIDYSIPLQVCTFSRVMKEKGIEDAIAAIKQINANKGYNLFELTIYGEPDKSYLEDFLRIEKDFPEYIKYGGVVHYADTPDILRKYFLLIFPSYYIGEGFPGTFIDAFSAGLPILASDWHCNSEIIQNGYNGWLFPPRDINKLKTILEYCSENIDQVINAKKNCLLEAEKYLPENSLKNFLVTLQKKGK